jgi:hypothetical protein
VLAVRVHQELLQHERFPGKIHPKELFRHTTTKRAPWYVVPADNTWFTRAVVGAAIVNALGDLDLDYPEIDDERPQELVEARRLFDKE